MPDPGKILEYPDKDVEVEAKLFNFDIAKYQLKPEHENWLRQNVVPLLKAGGSLALLGLASTTDKESFNLVLSRRRADSVVDFLRKEVSNKFKVVLSVAMGEKSARYAGVRDGFEDENWRAVVIGAWKKPDPPPPPPVPKPLPLPPLVERLKFVKILMDTQDSGGYGDSRHANTINDLALGKWRKPQIVKDEKERFPQTFNVIRIFTFLKLVETNLGLAKNSQRYCEILYNWAIQKTPCVLIHGYWREGALKNRKQSIYTLSSAQVDVFLNNPIKAIQNLNNWNLTQHKYEDWAKGRL